MLVLAVLWGWVFHRHALLDLHWRLEDVLIGIVASIPPFVFFLWTLKSNLRVFSRHRYLFGSLLRPIFGTWSILQLAIISLLAGICEEALFRWAIQGSLAEHVGGPLALVLASVLFGAVHPLTWTYAIIATLIGAYLGVLWVWTGNLLTPMVTHTVYDFLALLYFLRDRQLFPDDGQDAVGCRNSSASPRSTDRVLNSRGLLVAVCSRR